MVNLNKSELDRLFSTIAILSGNMGSRNGKLK